MPFATCFLCTVFGFIRQVALLRAEFLLPKLSFQSDIWRRAASSLTLPHISSYRYSTTRKIISKTASNVDDFNSQKHQERVQLQKTIKVNKN